MILCLDPYPLCTSTIIASGVLDSLNQVPFGDARKSDIFRLFVT